jgi:Flp pilus assembly protein TadG
MNARLDRDRQGAAAVEFALLLPLLLVLLVAVLEFGRAMWLRQTLQFAVEEAARTALAEDAPSVDFITARTRSLLALAGASAAGVQVDATLDPQSIAIAASTDFATLLPGILPQGSARLTARTYLPR